MVPVYDEKLQFRYKMFLKNLEVFFDSFDNSPLTIQPDRDLFLVSVALKATLYNLALSPAFLGLDASM